jgi:predicted anti-sigma-YlaC factor YlaD
MKCEELLAALNDYVDGERQMALCKALEAHLADCNPCQIVIDNIRNTLALYKGGKEVELPPDLHNQLCEILRQRWEAKFRTTDSSSNDT